MQESIFRLFEGMLSWLISVPEIKIESDEMSPETLKKLDALLKVDYLKGGNISIMKTTPQNKPTPKTKKVKAWGLLKRGARKFYKIFDTEYEALEYREFYSSPTARVLPCTIHFNLPARKKTKL